MSNQFAYSVKPYEFGDGSEGFIASLLHRPGDGATGSTPEDAVASLMQYVAEQAYDRALLPDYPDGEVKSDVIQRAMFLIATELRREVHAREQLMNFGDSSAQELQRRSERIGNLGTAIASLSRVKPSE